MKDFLTNGGLSKFLWIVLTFVLGLGSIIIAGVEIIQGQPVNTFVYGIILAIASHAFTIGGSINASTQIESHNSATK